MRDPNIILDILKKRSQNNLTINKIFPYLFKKEFYYEAFKRLNMLYKNESIISSNIEKRIDQIISLMRYERYNWNKIPKTKIKESTINFKQLQLNEWEDRLLEEVLYLILNSIYEPKFLDCSHGYRSNKNYSTALKRIYDKSQACEWFIKGSIQDIYSSMSYTTLLNILHNDIKDNRFIELIRKMLISNKLGYDYYRYTDNYMNIPQNGIISPIIVNIYLNELDKFIETTITPNFNKENIRPFNKDYKQLRGKIDYTVRRLKSKPNDLTLLKDLKELRKKIRYLKCKTPIEQCSFRRLTYTRYATEWLISFTGTHQEAEQILKQINQFITNNLSLTSITKIYNPTSNRYPVEFLGYNLITQWDNNRLKDKKKTLSGQIAFMIPNSIITKRKRSYMLNNKPIHMNNLINKPINVIIDFYQHKYKQIVNYYRFARNQNKLTTLKWIMEISMVKTIAAKLKTTCKKIYKKFQKEINNDNTIYKVIGYESSSGVSYFGGIPLKRQKIKHIEDEIL